MAPTRRRATSGSSSSSGNSYLGRFARNQLRTFAVGATASTLEGLGVPYAAGTVLADRAIGYAINQG